MPTDQTYAGHAIFGASNVSDARDAAGLEDTIPKYLKDTYTWAYVSPLAPLIFDHPLVVSAILWGNYHRLIETVVGEIPPASRVLQTACVYGSFSPRLADRIGPAGRLDIIDVAPTQVETARAKLVGRPHARVQLCDAINPPDGAYDVVCSFFLLHEVPEEYKRRIVDAILSRVGPGGKAVFVDYHRPRLLHPLRPIMWAVFRLLEPFAPPLWRQEIASYARAGHADDFTWSKQTMFGGLYQKVVARRRPVMTG